MRPTYFLTALLLPCFALSSPAPITENIEFREVSYSEKKPWVLSEISVFRATEKTPAASYIDFTFTDKNKGIRLNTHCRRTVLPGDNPPIDDASNYYPCANGTVGFKYNKGRMHVLRSYIDPAVGPPGMDVVTAFGHAHLKSTRTPTSCGVHATDAELLIPITSLIAK